MKKSGYKLITMPLSFLMVLGCILNAQAAEQRKGPLKDLPSEPKGDHLAKIKALGDNEWVELGSPAPDPKWGKACGRSWSPKAAYAPDLRGAFVFGEGPHGKVKPNGHYMDDIWFYDVNQHRWICVYPGMHAEEGYKDISIDPETGFEVTSDGQPIPIATSVHAYCSVTYDHDRGLFMMKGAGSGYWKPGYHKGITGRLEALKEHKEAVKKAKEEGNPPPWDGKDSSPYIYNTRTGRFERYRTENKGSRGGFGTSLTYVPSVKKVFGYMRWNATFGWYDPDKKDWIPVKRQGDRPPWHIDPNVCFDGKRDRIYVAGGIYAKPKIKPGESALWMFDVQTETFHKLEPEVTPTPSSYATGRAMFFYDSVNDAVMLFFHSPKKGREWEKYAIYAYHADENKWEIVGENVEQLKHGRYPTWTGYFDPVLNAHIMHSASDGSDDGTMFAYRYKRK